MKTTALAIALTLVTTGSLLSAIQQRDAAIRVTGDGAIAGVVMGAGATPVRRAVVSLTGASLAAARSVVTDDAGRFSFTRLPAGTFRATARKAAYLDAPYGSVRPGQEGSAIALGAGQRVDIVMTMFKGAAIAGVVRDAAGRALASVPVSVVDVRAREFSLFTATALQMTTDDRGAYRIFGLMPGEYLVAATSTPGGSGDIAMRSTAEMDAVLAALAQRQRNPGGTPAPLATAPSTRVGFAPIYHPGTAFYTDAGRVRVAAGEERDGIDIVATPVRVAAIEGTVSGNVTNLAQVELALVAWGPRFPSTSIAVATTPPDGTGAFAFRNLPPGRYRIVARARAGPIDPNAPTASRLLGGGSAGSGVRPAGAPVVYTGEQLFALADLQMNGQDIAGLTMTLQPGGSIAGRVVFEAAPASVPGDFTTIRVGLTSARGSALDDSVVIAGSALTSVPTVNVRSDATFQVNGIGPAAYQLSGVVPTTFRSVWTLRSAIVDGRDLLDDVIEGPEVRLSGVELTFSDQRTGLSGALQSASGQPTAQYFVVVFPVDRRLWREGSRRSLSARPSTDGRFVFTDLPAGDYFIAALTDLVPGEWQQPAFLEQVAAAAVRVTIAWGEHKVQDIRIR